MCALYIVVAALVLGACRWETGLPEAAEAIHIEPSRSLLVTTNLPEISLDRAIGANHGWVSADYRLLAVVNRTDLSVMPDRAADGGEGRLVFGHVREDRTLIVEYAQPGPAKTWAARWQSLDGQAAPLASLVADFGPIAQIRSAEASKGVVTLRQFAVHDGVVVEAALRNEPGAAVSSAELAAYADANAEALAEGTAVMPRAWWATSAVVSKPPSGMPADVANETCSGCHAKTATGFQIDPRSGQPTRFLSEPSAASDELRRRVMWMQLTLSQ